MKGKCQEVLYFTRWFFFSAKNSYYFIILPPLKWIRKYDNKKIRVQIINGPVIEQEKKFDYNSNHKLNSIKGVFTIHLQYSKSIAVFVHSTFCDFNFQPIFSSY